MANGRLKNSILTMNRATLHTTIACALALVVGAAIGGMRGTFSSSEGEASRVQTAGRIAPSDPAHSPLALAVKTELGAKGWLLRVAAAEKATVKDMPGIVRAAVDNYEAAWFLGIHWARLDPKHMFGEIYADFLQPDGAPTALPMRSALVDALFEQWTKADPAGVVKAIREAPNCSGTDSIRQAAVSCLMRVDVEIALQAMHEWKMDGFRPDMKAVAEWAARDPRHASEMAAKYASGYAAERVMAHIGKVWVNSDPEGGMQFAATLPAELRANLGTAIVGGWAEKDLAAAADFTASQSDMGFRNALANALLDPWAEKDPAAALAWSQENLRGTAATDAIGEIVRTAAEKDLVTAGELVAGLEAGSGQNLAAASLFATWFEKGKDQREAAIEWLVALPDKEAREAALERVHGNWAWNDPAGFRDFLIGPHRDLATKPMIYQAVRNEAAKNPEAAMEWAAKLAPEHVNNARKTVLRNWMQLRPEGATNFVRNLPAGPERETAIGTVTQAFGSQSPEQGAAWILTLSAAEQETAKKSFKNLSDERCRKIEDAMKKAVK